MDSGWLPSREFRLMRNVRRESLLCHKQRRNEPAEKCHYSFYSRLLHFRRIRRHRYINVSKCYRHFLKRKKIGGKQDIFFVLPGLFLQRWVCHCHHRQDWSFCFALVDKPEWPSMVFLARCNDIEWCCHDYLSDPLKRCQSHKRNWN